MSERIRTEAVDTIRHHADLANPFGRRVRNFSDRLRGGARLDAQYERRSVGLERDVPGDVRGAQPWSKRRLDRS
jgi:hypothetical protein